MPWTVADVDSHKKGLTDKQKTQWCRIANSVLKRCLAKGGTEETCAASAIKQANGAVMNANESKGVYSAYKNKQVLDYEVKLVVHQEKAHLVVPVVMMVEGVHNGSQGPLLHEISELGKFPESWNGRPVVIYHPEDEDGNPISANSPEVVDKITVGRVYNTEVDGKKLKAEVWFDEDKLNTVSPETLAAVNDMKEMEVSLGMFTENEMETGTYNDEEYVGIAHNHRPDHLAILPDQVGACSCKDGCGLGANKKDEDMKVEEMVKSLSTKGFSINVIGNQSEQGYQEKMQMVYSKLRTLETDKKYCYLEEMYDDSLVYSQSGEGSSKMYKQTYKIESGKIEFVGEPIEVHKKVEYVVNSGLTRTEFSINNKNKEDKKMPKNECPKCLEKINAVIANKQSGFVEADREWLETLSETALDKTITPKVIEKEKVVEKTVEVNKLSTEDQADLAWARDQRKARRENWVKEVVANTEKGTWEEATLNEMKDDVLERVFKSVKKESVTDYSVNGGVPPVVNNKSNSGGALFMPGIEIEESK
mgnify:CR=1 FL=1